MWRHCQPARRQRYRQRALRGCKRVWFWCVFGGQSYPALCMVLNMWTKVTRLHSGEWSGCSGAGPGCAPSLLRVRAYARCPACGGRRGTRSCAELGHEHGEARCGCQMQTSAYWLYHSLRATGCERGAGGRCPAHPGIHDVLLTVRLAWANAQRKSARPLAERSSCNNSAAHGHTQRYHAYPALAGRLLCQDTSANYTGEDMWVHPESNSGGNEPSYPELAKVQATWEDGVCTVQG